jgi:hypothetical protein
VYEAAVVILVLLLQAHAVTLRDEHEQRDIAIQSPIQG